MQLSIDFSPDLQRQHATLMDAVRASVYGCGRPFKHIAADLDMSVSELSRKLAQNPNDRVHFPLYQFVELMESTGDLTPLMWLIGRFIPDDDQRRSMALQNAEKLMADFAKVLSELKSDGQPMRAVNKLPV